MAKFLEKLKGYRTFILMTAMALLPLLDLMGTIDVVGLLTPFLGVDDAKNWAGYYAVAIAAAANALRFITTTPIFNREIKPKGDGESGVAGLVVLFIVLLTGLSANAYKMDKEGKPVLSVEDAAVAVENSLKNPTKPDWSKLND